MSGSQIPQTRLQQGLLSCKPQPNQPNTSSHIKKAENRDLIPILRLQPEYFLPRIGHAEALQTNLKSNPIDWAKVPEVGVGIIRPDVESSESISKSCTGAEPLLFTDPDLLKPST